MCFSPPASAESLFIEAKHTGYGGMGGWWFRGCCVLIENTEHILVAVLLRCVHHRCHQRFDFSICLTQYQTIRLRNPQLVSDSLKADAWPRVII